jgi:hypothetical protein
MAKVDVIAPFNLPFELSSHKFVKLFSSFVEDNVLDLVLFHDSVPSFVTFCLVDSHHCETCSISSELRDNFGQAIFHQSQICSVFYGKTASLPGLTTKKLKVKLISLKTFCL